MSYSATPSSPAMYSHLGLTRVRAGECCAALGTKKSLSVNVNGVILAQA